MKPFTLTTCVWGDLHTDAMIGSMFPTLLAPNNLPTLAQAFDVTYRIFTTHRDAERLAKHPLVGAISNHVKVQFIVATREEQPDPTHHVHWYDQAIHDARTNHSLLAFLPPDVAWSGVTLGNMGRRMAEGRLGTAMPYIRVVTETALPAIKALAKASDGSLDIAAGDLVRLAVEHLHPLSASVMDSSRHGRPSLEKLWRVADEGFVLRHMVRELFSFDPARMQISHLWYAGASVRPEDIHIVVDSDDMFMLSFAPLRKDVPLFLQDHSVDGIDVARSSLHPLNDTPLNMHFARHRVRLHYGATTPQRWRRAQAKSDIVFKQAMVAREAIQIWTAIRATGRCAIASQFLGAGLHASPMARRWPTDEPLTILVPTDAAFAGSPPWHLISGQCRDSLYRWLLGHVSAGPYDPIAGLSRRRSLAGTPLAHIAPAKALGVSRHTVLLIDQLPVQ
jgi:hypothetical protein